MKDCLMDEHDKSVSDSQSVSIKGTYTEHLNNLRQILAQDSYAGEPWMHAFVVAGCMILSQLAPAEKLQLTRPDYAGRLPALVRTPFVLGYIFGTIAAALDRGGIDRHSSEATSVIVTVHQLVFGGISFEDCIQLSVLASGDEDFSLGMDAAAQDADGFAASNEAPASLSKWLNAQLDVVAQGEKTP